MARPKGSKNKKNNDTPKSVDQPSQKQEVEKDKVETADPEPTSTARFVS